MNPMYEKPLSNDEFIELGELLASIPEPFDPMEADYLDGFLTGLLCLPSEPSPREWMPMVFDVQSRPDAVLPNPEEQDRLELLVYRRYRSIDQQLCKIKPIDPLIYDDGDDRNQDITLFLAPFASGFLEVMNRWEGLKDTHNRIINSALLGILRYLPEEQLGDLEEIKQELDLETPIEDLDHALEDIALSVAEIVAETRHIQPQAMPNKTKKKLSVHKKRL